MILNKKPPIFSWKMKPGTMFMKERLSLEQVSLVVSHSGRFMRHWSQWSRWVFIGLVNCYVLGPGNFVSGNIFVLKVILFSHCNQFFADFRTLKIWVHPNLPCFKGFSLHFLFRVVWQRIFQILLHPEVSRLLIHDQSWKFLQFVTLVWHGSNDTWHMPCKLLFPVHFFICESQSTFLFVFSQEASPASVKLVTIVTELVESDLYSWEWLSVFVFVSDYLGRKLMDTVFVLIGCVGEAAGDLVLHAVGQLRQTAFHLHLRQGRETTSQTPRSKKWFSSSVSSSRPV